MCIKFCVVCFNWSHYFELSSLETHEFEIENLRVELSSQSTVVEGIYNFYCTVFLHVHLNF